MLTIYGADLSAPANKVRMVANALGLKYAYKRVSLRDGEHKTPEYQKLHPASKVPVIDDDGFVLFESGAIIRYLADKAGSELYPTRPQERAIVEQWIDFGTIHIGGAFSKVIFNRVFAPRINVPVDENSLSDGLKFLGRFLPVIEEHLCRYRYLAGERMTLADINLVALMDPAEIAGIDLSPYPSIVQWREALKKQDFYTKCHRQYGESLQKLGATK